MVSKKQLLGLVSIGALALAACAPAAASAQATDTPATPRTISVSGTGTASGTPDIATVQVGVETRNTDAGQAVVDNSTAVERLMATLRRLGIAERDMQTSNFSIYPQQNYNNNGEPSGPITYVVSNSLTVTVRDIADLGDVLGQSVEAGSNQVYGISFSVADPSALEEQARTAAVANARARAEQLAAAAGVQLGDVVSISEATVAPPVPFLAREDLAANAASVPVATGQLDVQLNVSITYAIQ
jgi:hypothetical protein